MCAAAKFQVVFINWQEQSAFHTMQLNLLLYFHLSISCYLLKPVQKALLSSDTVSLGKLIFQVSSFQPSQQETNFIPHLLMQPPK